LKYLPKLNKNLDILECYDNKLLSIPDLNIKLRILDCSWNKLESLPNLNDELFHLSCTNNKLKSLPILNYSLKYLKCDMNYLTTLPSLNTQLKTLECSHNRLKFLPKLNHELENLSCNNNQLTYLPKLNNLLVELNCFDNNITHLPILNQELKTIIFSNNPIYEILFGNTINPHHHRYMYDGRLDDYEEYHEFVNDNLMSILELKNIVQTINNFKHLFYILKYKKNFRHFLWERIRRPKIEEKYHPSNLQKIIDNLNEDDDLNAILENW
jgi:Leucine-rich repeat (LRR) protein